MENNPVRIHSNRSPNPAKQKNYTVICHSHRVFTIVTARPAVVRKWIHRICNRHRHQLRHGRLVVGVGVQWAQWISNPPATLQICVGHRCLIFQLEYADNSPTVLRLFLFDARINFVGVWNYRDGDMLWDSRHRLEIRRLVDMRAVASDLRGCSRNISMERLADEILGMEGVEKEYVGRSDWDQEWLSEEQVKYACVDAFLSFLMAIELQVWDWG
ncbi:hypothetical protein DH2020_029295 [Rehmannia glutinosa]|uniref:3'-5' exonuclease domain-containing protein n=1 Tax=Rehmannia glutinosa TaxID=99300 RepID=A0ABR0VRZ3_REHGL